MEKIKTEPKSILKVKTEPKGPKKLRRLKLAVASFEPMMTPKIEGKAKSNVDITLVKEKIYSTLQNSANNKIKNWHLTK